MSTQTRDALTDLRSTLERMGGQFKAVMPTQQHVDRFIRVVMTAVQSNMALLEADRTSFYAACMRCAQDGLLPDSKQAVLIVYGKTVTYQPMVDGMMIKLRNSGEIIGAPKVHCWHEGDEFSYELGDNERIVHKPKLGARGKVLGAYSIVRLKSGDTSRELMTVEEINAIRERSKSSGSGPWVTDFGEMCRKVVFKRHAKRLPKSSDLDNMISYDNEQVGLADPIKAEPAAPAPARQASEQRRPAALAAVAEHGGTPMPTGPVPKQSEKVVEGEVVKPAAKAEERSGPPDDII